MAKFERLYRTDHSVTLSRVVLLADGLLSLSAEYGCRVGGDLTGDEAYVYYDMCDIAQERFELGELATVGTRVNYVNRLGGRSPQELLEEAAKHALSVVLELMQYVHLTRLSGVEYSLLVTKSGDIYVAEGGLGRVVLPYLGEVILEAHTHPGMCLPSERDLRTAMVRYMEGLYAMGVLSPNCLFLLYRAGPVTEEDLDLVRRIVEVVSHSYRGGVSRYGNLRLLILRT